MAKLHVIARDGLMCLGGKCPTLYQSDEGHYYMQGYIVSENIKSLAGDMPEGETMIRITPELLETIKNLG